MSCLVKSPQRNRLVMTHIWTQKVNKCEIQNQTSQGLQSKTTFEDAWTYRQCKGGGGFLVHMVASSVVLRVWGSVHPGSTRYTVQ